MPDARTTILFLLALGLFGLGCGREPSPPAPTPEVAASPAIDSAAADVDESFQRHMQWHFVLVTEARRAVVRADIDAFRRACADLVTHPGLQDLPEDWQRRVEEMRTAASKGAEAADLDAAAAVVTEMARTCGACHRDTGATPDFPGARKPTGADGITNHMQRHAWAGERLYEALVGPSDAAWAAALTMLAEGVLDPDEMPEGLKLTPEAQQQDGALHALAVDGLEVQEPDKRADLFTGFVRHCTGCHAHYGRGG